MAGSGTAHLRPSDETLLTVRDLVVDFDAGRGRKVHAVSGISFDVAKGETLGLVGESGCGKSTTGRAVLGIHPPTSGSVRFDGVELTELDAEALRRTRPEMQMIFQDPISSLNPRRRVRDIVREGLAIWGGEGVFSDTRVDEILEAVGLDPDGIGGRRPHEFSGGQCQRICIARALVLDPRIIVCDEPVSALDVSVQAQILNLLEETKRRFGLTLVFIAHDLAVVKSISDRVLVMYLGKMCETGTADAIYSSPRHPYTHALLTSIPHPDPTVPVERGGLGGEVPSAVDPPSGCRFRTRCPRATEICERTEPTIEAVADDHWVACHHPFEPGEVQVSWMPQSATGNESRSATE